MTTGRDTAPVDLDSVREPAGTPRVDSLRATADANDGHPTSASSVADHTRPANDRFVPSQGHASVRSSQRSASDAAADLPHALAPRTTRARRPHDPARP